MADTNTNEMIIQPNPYAGGIPRRPLCYPNAKKYPQGSGGTPPNSGLGSGQNSITLDDDVSLSGPGTQLNGTQQKTEPLPGGPARPLNPGSDLIGAITGSTPAKNNPGGSGAASGNGTGWRQSGADWYYFDTSTGEMAKGWKLIENKWYYFNQNGIMQKDWLLLGNKWYYLDVNNGAMDTGWLLNNGDHYYLDADGHMLTGWQQLDGAWYYFYPPNGKMTYGDWLEIGGKWYYFHPDGKMAASEIAVYKPNGQKYYLGESGAMITSDDAEQVTYKGVTYSVDEKGVCTAIRDNVQVKIDNWMASVESMGNWYTQNIHTYQQADSAENATNEREYYYCALINMKVGDDCSSYVSACLVPFGIAKNAEDYSSNSFNKAKQSSNGLINRLEKYGFVWHLYDASCIPARGDISVQHKSYTDKKGKPKHPHHVEVVDSYNAETDICANWSWGDVYTHLPTTRDNWRARISGYWRIEQ